MYPCESNELITSYKIGFPMTTYELSLPYSLESNKARHSLLKFLIDHQFFRLTNRPHVLDQI